MKHLTIAIMAVLLLSCKKDGSATTSTISSPMAARDSGAAYQVANSRAALAQEEVAALPPPPSPKTPPTAERMIIRNATLSIVVRDAADVLRKATALVEGRGGYVANERQWKEGDQVRASAVLRVPAAQLKEILRGLSGLSVRVENEAITGDDVSQEFSDLGAQLKNLQATEAELRALLATVRQRTQKAAEIMEVFNALTEVRGNIERIQGRMQYLSQMTSLATITLDLIPDAIAAPVVEAGWQPMVTARAAMRSLVNTMKALTDVVIWAAFYILPIAVVFMAVVLAVRAAWLAIRRRRFV